MFIRINIIIIIIIIIKQLVICWCGRLVYVLSMMGK